MARTSPYVAVGPPPVSRSRETLTPRLVASLLTHYKENIYPRYPLPLTADNESTSCELTINDDLSLHQRTKTLLGCALSALHLSHRCTEWLPIARLCRDWASELVPTACEITNEDSLSIVVALLLYEIVEPTRGLLWALYDSSIRFCLEMGWHTFDDSLDHPPVEAPEAESGSDQGTSSFRARILSVLQFAHR